MWQTFYGRGLCACLTALESLIVVGWCMCRLLSSSHCALFQIFVWHTVATGFTICFFLGFFCRQLLSRFVTSLGLYFFSSVFCGTLLSRFGKFSVCASCSGFCVGDCYYILASFHSVIIFQGFFFLANFCHTLSPLSVCALFSGFCVTCCCNVLATFHSTFLCSILLFQFAMSLSVLLFQAFWSKHQSRLFIYLTLCFFQAFIEHVAVMINLISLCASFSDFCVVHFCVNPRKAENLSTDIFLDMSCDIPHTWTAHLHHPFVAFWSPLTSIITFIIYTSPPNELWAAIDAGECRPLLV